VVVADAARLTLITLELEEQSGNDIAHTAADMDQRAFFAYNPRVRLSTHHNTLIPA
jgi:hypothetical protein